MLEEVRAQVAQLGWVDALGLIDTALTGRSG
jgi:hypothetical protein